jgi:hypothetical protein
MPDAAAIFTQSLWTAPYTFSKPFFDKKEIHVD